MPLNWYGTRISFSFFESTSEKGVSTKGKREYDFGAGNFALIAVPSAAIADFPIRDSMKAYYLVLSNARPTTSRACVRGKSMKLEKQVCSLERANRLKELGVKQDSSFH